MFYILVAAFGISLVLIALFCALSHWRKDIRTGKLSKTFFGIGLSLFVLYTLFWLYTAFHPQTNLLWSIEITYVIYISHVVVMILAFLIANGIKVIRKIRK